VPFSAQGPKWHKLTADGHGSTPEQSKVSHWGEPRMVLVSASGMGGHPMVLTKEQKQRSSKVWFQASRGPCEIDVVVTLCDAALSQILWWRSCSNTMLTIACCAKIQDESAKIQN
jgi:hypothetical protein